MEVRGHLHASAAYIPGEIAPGTHSIGGWVGPRAGLDAVEKRKILPLEGVEPRPSTPSLYRLICHGSFSSPLIDENIIPLNISTVGKLTVSQLVKITPAFYKLERFITVFTRAHHRSLTILEHSYRISTLILSY
jgi:hypothetical protein